MPWAMVLTSTLSGLTVSGLPAKSPSRLPTKSFFPSLSRHMWGHLWFRQHILFRSDNKAVVAILNSRTSKVPCIMCLVRSLLMAAARFNFSFAAVHVPGVENPIADALSRFRWQDFRQLAPWAYGAFSGSKLSM